MKKCNECGKELKFFEGYRHPTLGKEHNLCSPCFDIVDESVTKWREFVTPYFSFFNNESTNNDLQLNKEKIQPGFVQTKKRLDNVLIRTEG